jgi:hypothetical protein
VLFRSDMADKKSPASGWPLVKGDFISGDSSSPVAVVTMGSHLDEKGLCDAGAAMCGSCKTENLGLEKVAVLEATSDDLVNMLSGEGNFLASFPNRDHGLTIAGTITSFWYGLAVGLFIAGIIAFQLITVG